MIRWFQRWKLVRKGLACDKMRRTSDAVAWRDYLESSYTGRALLCLTFTSYIFLCGAWWHDNITPTLLLLTFVCVASSILFLHLNLPEIWRSNSKLLLVFAALSFDLFISKALYLWSTNHEKIIASEIPFLIPTAFAPLLISVLLGTRAGLCTVVMASLTDSLLINQSFPLLVVSLTTGFTAVFFTRQVRRRSDLIRAGGAIGVASFLCALAYGVVSNQWAHALWEQALFSIAVGIVTAAIINSLLPIIETLFQINTDISWIELADLNHPALRQMTLQAPGTYHHSLIVANLAEAAAIAIGANATLCRVMAYFHDIGKVQKPEYFGENSGPHHNPHDPLSPTMSALIIIAHVKEGVDLALKYGLKQPIIDAIQQHHGDSLIYYFYRRARQQNQDARAGSEIMNLREEDVPDVSEQGFRYPGPRPQSKEVGLLMLADSIEAASRSLDKPTPQRIEEMVHEIIAEKITDRQLDDCDLSLKDLRLASETFTFTLKTMLHSRISYPKNVTATHPVLQSTKRIFPLPAETRTFTSASG